jgi:two-component system sensor histidine kinase QseC
VRVEIARRGALAETAVIDQGPGVALEERAKLGERFYRILGTGETGSGLGLSIARRIAEIHGGELTFGDAAEGRGLRARVALPSG